MSDVTAKPHDASDPDALHAKYLEERDRRLRADGVEQYVAVEGDLESYAADPYVKEPLVRDAVAEDIDVVVVGGGFSGLLAARSLIEAGVTDFRLIEKGGDFGGTWYWNRYPGCRCDVDSYTYLPLIEHHGEMPKERYSRASHILEHSRRIARDLGLYGKSLLQTGVTGMHWDAATSRWMIATDRGDALRARFVIMASGILSRPKLPGIPGVKSFKGHSFHSARWDYAYTGGDETGNMEGLKDKRVAIIGTGASAVQAIPALAESCGRLYVVQRTPAAVDARENRPTDAEWWKALEPGWWERRARNFEGFVIGLPQEEDLIQDGWSRSWSRISDAARHPDAVTPEEQGRRRQLADYEKMDGIRQRIDAIVKDKGTAESLKPYFNWMCKRPLFVDGYFEAFNNPNVTLLDTKGKGLDRITENAIVLDGKAYEVDCIIYASGFEVAAAADRTGHFEMTGADGRTLAEYWKDGMKTLHGIFVRNFPNMAVINGLKQAAITWSITFMMRRQSEHVAAVIKRCLDTGVSSFDVKEDAQLAWRATLEEKSIKDTTFLRECTPGYYNNEGKNQRDSIWLSSYGGGPFEYMDLMESWRQGGFDRDLEFDKAAA